MYLIPRSGQIQGQKQKFMTSSIIPSCVILTLCQIKRNRKEQILDALRCNIHAASIIGSFGISAFSTASKDSTYLCCEALEVVALTTSTPEDHQDAVQPILFFHMQ